MRLLLAVVVCFVLVPTVFGQGTCGDAPGCGVAMAEMDGIAAYSNGKDQCSGTGCGGEGTYGLQYECVELAQRYFAKKYGVTPYIWGGNANQLCGTHPSSVEQTSTPAHGYLAVLNMGEWGHVGVINRTVGSSSIEILEQNNHPNGVGTYPTSMVLCYLKPKSASSPPPSGPSCAGMVDGWFCGNDGVGGSPNVNYFCSGGKVAQTQACGFTCVTMPHGQNDQCTSTGSCKSAPTSYLCGNDGVGGAADILFLCENGAPHGAKYCSDGCQIVSGANDQCKT